MKKSFILSFICAILLAANPINAIAWGGDIIVEPVSGRYYSEAKVSVAYDGTIYYARLYSTSPSGPKQNYEVLKSTDNGNSFTVFKNNFVSSSLKYTNIEILAAGDNSDDFALYVGRTFIDTTSGSSTITVSKHTIYGNNTTVFTETYTSYSTVRGWESLSMASDWRSKNSDANPYTFSVGAVKAGGYDSVIVWSHNKSTVNMKRKAVEGYSGYIRSVSVDVGTANQVSDYGRLGIVWDFNDSYSDTLGGIKVMFLFPDDLTSPFHTGPYTIGLNATSYGKPIISLSQKNDGVSGGGIGENDIRAIVYYEYVNGYLNARVSDSIILKEPNFNTSLIVNNSSHEHSGASAVYDPVDERFLVTYYNKADNSLVYKGKSLKSDKTIGFNTIKSNYRDASTSCNYPVQPIIDININGATAVFAWNDNLKSMLEFEANFTSIDENNDMVTQLNLFPNPSSDFINISFNSVVKQDINIKIYDLSGREVYSLRAEVLQGENLIHVDTDNLEQGQYVVMVSSVNNNYPIKLIINR